MSSPRLPGHLVHETRLEIDYALRPLTYTFGQKTGDIIRNQIAFNLVATVGLWDALLVSGGFKFIGTEGPVVNDIDLPSADGFGIGDAWVLTRLRLIGEKEEGIALEARLNLPLANWLDDTQNYRGAKSVYATLDALAAIRLFDLSLSASVGISLREEFTIYDAKLDPFGLRYGLSVSYPLFATTPLQANLHADLRGSMSNLGDLSRPEYNPLEFSLGPKIHFADISAGIAAGTRFTRGLGSANLRVLAMFGWTPTMKKIERKSPEPIDSDSDGIVDELDLCPFEKETQNNYKDGDGCPDELPDLDIDRDGIQNSKDKCPTSAEDIDGFEDEDGCPDTDNDSDEILDIDDKCPNEKGVIEMSGCPDPDRDGDGVVDRLDNCPDEPGDIWNGGCIKEQRVKLTPEKIEILEFVFFKTNDSKIRKKSFALLNNVALVLLAHPEIQSIRVEGHTDDKGSQEKNLLLSQDRAESVVNYLIQKGVPSERLSAKGFGEDKPLEENLTKTGRAANRRVEFIIINF